LKNLFTTKFTKCTKKGIDVFKNQKIAFCFLGDLRVLGGENLGGM